MSEHDNWIDLVRRWLIEEVNDETFIVEAQKLDMAEEAVRAIYDRDFELAIKKLPVQGRIIVDATIWQDGTNASIVLDDGSIIQIQANPKPGDELREALVKWFIEPPTDNSGSNQT